ncbi:carboxypeptidase-like regulatory domain-containing protein [Hymenobacter cavernae]|uniref:Fibronectin type-III domain-containing protein n=1 Tax=Hymenobacter cavernae TaxID=2044852 RepID=A0ABQ1TMF2_9BACT|nr:carboxypeptidase-like regulatory domain-containing protein [Hymenobacter cavernae]GGE97093.1 hypothetical protein GCM10011383_04790 [Hymenobacter cavernae]
MLLALPRTLARFSLLKTTCLLFTLLFAVACEETTVEPAQVGSLSGIVLDARTNKPLSNVAISTNPATSSYVTDAQGKFTISDAPIGKLLITASKVDYQQVQTNVTVVEDTTVQVSLLLEMAASAVAPSAPVKPEPTDQATDQPINVMLKWHPINSIRSDSLRYDVELVESGSTGRRTLLTNAADTTVQTSGLLYNTTYFWQVTVRNKAGVAVRGSLWSFRTRALPDNRFLYVRAVNGNTDIYSSDDQGNNIVRLTNSAFVETAPQLSPNRDRVAYTSNELGQFQLYTMNRDGSDKRRISLFSVDGYNNPGVGYRWSPDGSQLIYAHYNVLYRVNRDGTGHAVLATAPTGRHFRECDWTAQGNRILVQTIGTDPFDSEVYLMNADGSNPTLVLGNLPGRLDSPSFSIDGRDILYTRDLAGFNDATGRQLNAHVLMLRADGSTIDVSAGNSVPGTPNTKPAGTNDLYPHYTPDGSKIIFVNTSNDNLSPPEVWVMDLDGRNRTRLFQNATLPDWK